MDLISVNILNIIGRVTERDKVLGNVFALYNADWSSANAYAFQFGVQSQGQTFGVVRSMKVDNGSNPENVEVAISGTDDYFTIPAYSIGVYTVNANAGSTVTLTSQGGATDLCTITFYNYEVAPAVWYSFGAFNSDRPVKTQGTMKQGSEVVATGFNNPVFIAGVNPNGKLKAVNVDANGNITVSNLDITIGAVYGPDAVGAAPTRPGVLGAVLDSAGNVKNVQLNAAAELPVFDNGANTKLTAANASLDAIEAKLTPPDTGAITTVASTLADATILAANAARKGAIIFNDSTAVLRLALANVDARASFSVAVEPQGSFVISNGDYTGVIKGTWVAVNGNARVTQVV